MAGQHPVAKERQRAKDGEVSETNSKKDREERTRVNAALSVLPTPFLQVYETLYFPSAAGKKQFFLLKLAGVC